MENMIDKHKLLIKHVESLNEEQVLSTANELLKEGMEPLELLELINAGMNKVGKLYESKDYYIADLIMAGIIFKEVLELDKMTAHFNSVEKKKIGRVILGTVKGDIHDIGKDIFRGMLEINGFDVVDLGVDVPKELFVKKFDEYQPDIVAISGVLTYTVDSMKDVVDSFIEAGIRDKVKVIVGGNHLTHDACEYIGADGYAVDASVGLKFVLNGCKVRNREISNELSSLY